jgi:ribosomal protein S12 methylthiotransferase accessory factor
MENTWNRKECKPQHTVEALKHIFKELHINTRITNEVNNIMCHSTRLEIEDIPGIGANGKGINLDYSHASAYAELVERLQSGFLLNSYYPMKRDRSKDIDLKETVRVYRAHLGHYVHSLDDDQLAGFLMENTEFIYMHDYVDMLNKERIQLPDAFISCICGSNGLASGNSFEEACVQGIGEIFERYVSRQVFYDSDIAFTCETLNEEYYMRTKSYGMIREIEKKGYTVVVKDCSMGGVLPVLAVIVLNASRSKYTVRFGSDIDFDICLQRCLTETFQGFDISLNYKMHMRSFENDYIEFWNLKNADVEFYKNILNGKGKIPRSFFAGAIKAYDGRPLSPWLVDHISNSEVMDKYLEIIRRLGLNLYLKDFSSMGFHTVRLFIPEISGIVFSTIFDVMSSYTHINALRKSIFTATENSDASHLLLSIENCLKLKFFSDDYSYEKFIGILTNYDSDSLYKRSMHFYASMVCLYLNEYNKAEYYLMQDQYLRKTDQRKNYLEIMVLEAVHNAVPKAQLSEYFKNTLTPKEIQHVENLYNSYSLCKDGLLGIRNCGNCNICIIQKNCLYPQWKSIVNKINCISI